MHLHVHILLASPASTGEVRRFAAMLDIFTTRHVISSDPPVDTIAHSDSDLRQMSSLSACGHQLACTAKASVACSLFGRTRGYIIVAVQLKWFGNTWVGITRVLLHLRGRPSTRRSVKMMICMLAVAVNAVVVRGTCSWPVCIVSFVLLVVLRRSRSPVDVRTNEHVQRCPCS